MLKQLMQPLLICIIFLPVHIWAKSELWYAHQIQKDADILKNNSNYPTLMKFVNNTTTISSTEIPIIMSEYDKYYEEMGAGQAVKVGKTSLEYKGSAILSQLQPGIKQEDIYLAATDVLLDRAKEELARAYFDRTVTILDTTKIELSICNKNFSVNLKSFMPNVYNFLNNSRSNMDYRIGSMLINSFRQDIRELPESINDHVLSNCSNEEWYVIYDASFKVFSNLKKGNDLSSSLKEIYSESPNSNIEYVLNSIYNTYTSTLNPITSTPINLHQIKLTPKGLLYYTTLLYLSNEKTFNKLGITTQNSELILKNANRLTNIAIILQQSTTKKTGSASDPIGNNKNNDIVEIIPNLLFMISDIYTIKGYDNSKLLKGIELTEDMILFYRSIANENYSYAASVGLQILNRVTESQKPNSKLLKYISLAADISQAQNLDEAKKIFENAILPVGSYRIKRSVAFSASINAYVGANVGMEIVPGNIENAGYISPFLPIGAELSWSKGTEDMMKASKSIFISAIDLGVIAGYRLNNNKTDTIVTQTPEIKFKHIFSPGIFGIIGLAKSPVSIGAGAQYTPSLRKIKDVNTLEISEKTSVRITGFFAVDIPMFNLSVKGKKQKKD